MFLLYIVSFIYIYNVPFTGSPLSGSKLMIPFMLVWLAVKRKGFVFSASLIKLVGWMLLLIVYSLANVFLQGTGDMGLVYAEALFVINHILGCALLLNLFQSMGKTSIEDIMHMIVVISCVQAVIIILSMFIPTVNSFISNIAFIKARERLQFGYGHARGYGLAASVTYELAVCQAFAIMFIPYLTQRTHSIKRKAFYAVAFLPILFSILPLGRTGFVGVGLTLIYVTLENSKSLLKIVRNFFYVAAVTLIGAAMFLVNRNSSVIANLNAYVFEGFDTLLSTGELKTGTGTELINFLGKLKDFTTKIWIIGDARFTQGKYYYMRVDIGFMRDILYFGLVGCFILAIEYVVIYRMLQRGNNSRQLRLLVRLMFIFLLIAHFKGEFLLGCSTGICMVLLLAFAGAYKQKPREVFLWKKSPWKR